MSLAEVFLRIGGAFGAWLILAAYALVLAVVPSVACDPATGEPFRGTFFFGLVALVAVPLLGLGRPWKAWFRWIPAVVLPLALWDLTVILPYFQTLSGTDPCSIHSGVEAATPVTLTNRLWPVLHAVVLLGTLWSGFRYWRSGAPEPEL